MMDYPCGKFGDCSFSHFSSIVRTDTRFVLLGIYRPGSQALTTAFFDELTSVFEQLIPLRCPVVVCGDLNIHVDQTDDVHAVRLVQLLKSFDCVQHVAEPTHVAGHTLDLVYDLQIRYRYLQLKRR